MASAEITAAFPKEKKFSAAALALVTFVSVAAIVAAGYGSAQWGIPLAGSWGIAIAFLIVFLAALGLRVHDRIGGALIDEQKLMSLSRFQLVAWTVLIVSTILIVGITRGFATKQKPTKTATESHNGALDFIIPKELWMLLGITAAGAVGKEVVNAAKKDSVMQNPDVAAMQAAEAINQTAQGAERTTVQEVETNRMGTLYANPSAKDASIVDMFQGNEVGNTAFVDISKVQMFFFTIAALVAYGADVFDLLSNTKALDITELPKVGSGLLAILAVSHAAYIGAKVPDHTNGVVSADAHVKANAMKTQPADDPAEIDG